MSAILDCALALARQKVRLFPVRENSKVPATNDFSARATSDPEALTEMFGGRQHYNSGIACGKVAEGLYLVGFDIDVKNGKNGFDTLELLAELDCTFPETWSQRTPSGGEHRLFWSSVPIRQGVDVVGSGIDLRGDGGLLVGPGSTINGIPYSVLKDLPIAQFPQWAVEKFAKRATVHAIGSAKNAGHPAQNQVYALKRCVEYLNGMDVVHEGARNDALFKVAAKLKDFGIAREQIVDVILEYWRCEPMLPLEEIELTAHNAYRNSSNPVGIEAPENLFPVSLDPPSVLERDPVDVFNDRYFYMASDGVSRVCWETTREGKFHLERFPVHVFHEKHVSEKMKHNGRDAPASKVWFESPKRRSYDYARFNPGGVKDPRAYNTWKGFAVSPHEGPICPEAAEGARMFLEHCEQNICGGDKELNKWLLSFMAHIFQKPGQKPGVSLVFQGDKGTGKTIVSEILDHLIGDNSAILSKSSDVLGHFNSIMEDKILVTLDEAFWSGDKSVEGVLKDLITGKTRMITHKGINSYPAPVFDRIIIIGNEDWLVPASSDERRFAVFKVGNARQQDTSFFGGMKDRIMEGGGDRLLMKFFMEFDISGLDINQAPETEGLNEQKNQSLGIFQQWWFNCLQEGQLIGSGLTEWPKELPVRDLYQSFVNQMEAEGHRGFRPYRNNIGKILHRIYPSIGGSKVIAGNVRTYFFNSLAEAREDWDKHRRFKTRWD